MPDDAESLGLAEAIAALRAEFETAMKEGAASVVQFPIAAVAVELTTVAKRSKDGKAGFRVPVVGAELGATMGRASESTQKVTVTFGAPVDRAGRVVLVTGVSGQDKS